MNYASIEEAMTSGYGIERSFLCHAHEDRNASASVNSVTGLWFCYACHARGKFDMTRIDFDPYQVKRSLDLMIERVEAESRVYPESWLSQFDASGPGRYWLSRFHLDTCTRHRLGQSFNRQVATIPFRDNAGRVLGVIRRDLTGLDHAKYRYPSGVDMQDYLYNYHRVTGRTILLTEGATDTIAADEAGFPGALAVYGSSLSRSQVILINKLDPARVLCAFDQDKAGRDGFARLSWDLRHYRVERMTWPMWKDLSSIPLPIRTRLIQTHLDRA